jgi:hypothetical protein
MDIPFIIRFLSFNVNGTLPELLYYQLASYQILQLYCWLLVAL